MAYFCAKFVKKQRRDKALPYLMSRSVCPASLRYMLLALLH